MPRTSLRIAEELHDALNHLGISPPYILVGAAFGGDNMRTFVDLHLDQVAGMVLVDADATDLEPAQMQELDRQGRPSLIAQLRECGHAIAAHEPLPAFDSEKPERTCAQDLFFRGLPEASWSPELNAKVLEIAQTRISMYEAYASEMEQMTSDEEYLQRRRRSLGSRPIRVLTSGNHGVPAHVPNRTAYENEIARAQARWLTLSSNARQIFSKSESEYIQFDDPETVISAIREVYAEAGHSQTSARAALKLPSGSSNVWSCHLKKCSPVRSDALLSLRTLPHRVAWTSSCVRFYPEDRHGHATGTLSKLHCSAHLHQWCRECHSLLREGVRRGGAL
jgi:pimeloyl-ACP methyl ester carboxylesterase